MWSTTKLSIISWISKGTAIAPEQILWHWPPRACTLPVANMRRLARTRRSQQRLTSASKQSVKFARKSSQLSTFVKKKYVKAKDCHLLNRTISLAGTVQTSLTVIYSFKWLGELDQLDELIWMISNSRQRTAKSGETGQIHRKPQRRSGCFEWPFSRFRCGRHHFNGGQISQHHLRWKGHQR